jgi:hypothetical protein
MDDFMKGTAKALRRKGNPFYPQITQINADKIRFLPPSAAESRAAKNS